MPEQHQTRTRPYTPALSDRLASAARAQPAGLLLLLAGASLILSGMRPPGPATTRRAKAAVRKISQGDFSDVGSTAASARDGVSGAASHVKEQVAEMGSKAGELARSYSDSLSGFADDAQQAVRERSQRLAEGARYSAQSGLSFVLEDQPLILAAIGVAAGAALGAILPGTIAENRMMGDTRDKVAELASETAKQKLGELGSAASEATERLKNAADRAGLNADDLTKVAKEVVEPFTTLASSGGASGGQGGSPSGQQSQNHSGGPSTGSSGTSSSGTGSSGTGSSGTGSSGAGSSGAGGPSAGKIS